MQIYALDAQSNLIHVQHAERRLGYTCPECASEVRLRGGHLKELHFYHPESSACGLRGKSAIHLHVQLALQKMLQPETTSLEHRFPEIGRIADVVWHKPKLIFEVQVSPITAEEVEARNRDYSSLGFQVVWILHDRQFNRTHMSSAERHLRSSPHYFTNINSFGKGIFYDQYAEMHFKRRIRRSRRLPVQFTQFASPSAMQLPSQFCRERKKWDLSFAGDLFHYPHLCCHTKKIISPLKKLGRLYRALFNILLEKHTL